MEAKGVDYEFINVKKEPLTLEEIKDLEFKVGMDVLMNTRGMTYRKLGLKDKDLSKEELLKVMQENQSIIKRPVIVNENSVLVGYDEEAFESFLIENGIIEGED